MKVKVTQSCVSLCDHMDYTRSPWNSPGQNTEVGSFSVLQGIFPTQGSNPGLPHSRRILYQLSHKGSLRILEWVAYPFSRQIFAAQESNQGLLLCRWILYQLSYLMLSCFRRVWFFATLWTVARQASLSMGFSRQDTGVSCRFLLQGNFLTQRWKPWFSHLPHW